MTMEIYLIIWLEWCIFENSKKHCHHFIHVEGLHFAYDFYFILRTESYTDWQLKEKKKQMILFD